MEKIDYNSPAFLKNFLESRGLSMQKKFGQNFLVNGDARKKLIDALDISEKSTVWEVGPGLGCMTDEILKRGAKVTAFEIDRGFSGILLELFGKNSSFSLVQGDVLKTWLSEKEANGVPDRFFSNLPYNIAATVIADMISHDVRFDRCVVTVQKEVAQRITAACGSEDYSSFSVLCQWAYEVTPLADLGGGNFWPRPNVDSRSVLMVKRSDFPRCEDPALFMKLLRAMFLQRRKTIKNNLSGFAPLAGRVDQVLSDAKIDPSVRAERLSLEEMLFLCDCCSRVLKNNQN